MPDWEEVIIGKKINEFWYTKFFYDDKAFDFPRVETEMIRQSYPAFLQKKINEYKDHIDTKKLKKMPPRPFVFPSGGIATIKTSEEDQGTVATNYCVKLSQLKPHLYIIDLKFEVNGTWESNDNLIPIVPITKGDIKDKLVYWHAESFILFFTHRAHFQLAIQYTSEHWQQFAPDLKMNFDVYNIPTPDSDSSSDGEGLSPVAIPGPEMYPFYRSF